jgi:hypothetical protein
MVATFIGWLRQILVEMETAGEKWKPPACQPRPAFATPIDEGAEKSKKWNAKDAKKKRVLTNLR